MRYSSFDASDLFLNFLEYASFTGRRARVYFDPRSDVLCSWILFLRSVVIPV